MVTSAIILKWMLSLVSFSPHLSTFPRTASAIALVCNEDPDPLDAATWLVSIAYYESKFDQQAVSRKDDPTHSYGLFQVSSEWAKPPFEPESQARLALRLVRDSLARCGSLAMYTSGRCDIGKEEAERRGKLAAKLKQGLMPGVYLEANYPKIVSKQEWVAR